MFNFFKRYKIVIIVVFTDLFLYWLLFYSGIVLPFINPSLEQYKEMVIKGTSFPRNTNQILIWIFLHLPSSYIIDGITRNDRFLFLSVIQTGLMTYYIHKFILRRNRWRVDEWMFVLKWVIAMFMLTMTIKIIMNIINAYGINFVKIFQEVWEKLRNK